MPSSENVRSLARSRKFSGLTFLFMSRRPAFRLEVDTTRRAVWAHAQGQTAT